jgi:hypothetical protein
MLCGKVLIIVQGRVPRTRLVCVHIKLSVHGPIHVLGNVMSNFHCLLPAFGQFSNLEWVAMVCLGTGSWAGIPRIDRVRRFCGAGSMGGEKHLVFECPHLQFIRDKFQRLACLDCLVYTMMD